jgi:hypothetical protein
MKTPRKACFFVLFLLGLFIPSLVNAYPSGGAFPPTFEKHGDFWYDSWGITRNSYAGQNGYLPNIFYETIGEDSDLAYKWGHEFQQQYTSRHERAQAILRFVQQWVVYGYDEDNVFMEGEAQIEWAWNGDEMAYMIQRSMNNLGTVRGDCEDMAFLCATMYYGAGFDVAIVEAPSHCALLIWFPEYPDANIYWKIQDGRGFGWIWVEATGRNNDLGWTPPSFSDGDFTAYPIESGVGDAFLIEYVSYKPSEPSGGEVVTVDAKVTTITSQVRNATLVYYVDGGKEQRVEMLYVDDALYRGNIPGQDRGSEVEFHIQVFGVGGESTSSGSFVYAVKDTVFGVDPLLFYVGVGLLAIIVLASIV